LSGSKLQNFGASSNQIVEELSFFDLFRRYSVIPSVTEPAPLNSTALSKIKSML
jgi:hypothetical protein